MPAIQGNRTIGNVPFGPGRAVGHGRPFPVQCDLDPIRSDLVNQEKIITGIDDGVTVRGDMSARFLCQVPENAGGAPA